MKIFRSVTHSNEFSGVQGCYLQETKRQIGRNSFKLQTVSKTVLFYSVFLNFRGILLSNVMHRWILQTRTKLPKSQVAWRTNIKIIMGGSGEPPYACASSNTFWHLFNACFMDRIRDCKSQLWVDGWCTTWKAICKYKLGKSQRPQVVVLFFWGFIRTVSRAETKNQFKNQLLIHAQM